MKLMHSLRHLGQRTLVIEDRAIDVPDQLERAPAKMNERLLGCLLPVSNQLVPRRGHSIRQELQDVFTGDTKRPTLCTSSLTRSSARQIIAQALEHSGPQQAIIGDA